MRTLIPLLLLAVAGYVGWYYWQVYTDQPLSQPLLLNGEDALREVTVTSETEDFRIFRTAEFGWVISGGGLEIYDQTDRAEKLIGLLTGLHTDSVMHRTPGEGGVDVKLIGTGDPETLTFYFRPQGPLLARIAATGDVFALPKRHGNSLQNLLRFAGYRSRRLLRGNAESIDSVRLVFHDSLLWRSSSAQVSEFVKTFIAPAAAPYADHFDEITDREKYFATVKFYTGGVSRRVDVYRDSLWPLPYVLVGEDFPRTYLAMDSLGIPAEYLNY